MSLKNPVSLIVNSNFNDSKIILQRHLKTLFNKRSAHALNNKDTNALFNCRFDINLIDSELTEDAYEDMIRADYLKSFNITRIYTSPARRALLTTKASLKLLENSPYQSAVPKIDVHPLLFEKVEDSCDLNYNINHKSQNEFKHIVFRGRPLEVDWSRFKNLDIAYQLRYLDTIVNKNNHTIDYSPLFYYNLSNSMLENTALSQKEHKYNNVLCSVIEHMKELSKHDTYIESYKSVHNRLKEVNTHILQENIEDLNNKNNKILIIGHSVLFRYWLVDELKSKETLDPVYDRPKLNNCELIGVDFKK